MALTEIQKLRLAAGDNDPDFPYLTDEEYQHFIDTYPSHKKRAKAITLAILAMASNDVHERSGQDERWGGQAFEQRMALFKLQWKDPRFNGSEAVPLFGGTSREEMAENALDPDRVADTFYKGEYRGRAEWQDQRIYQYIGMAREPYTDWRCWHGVQA